MKIKKLIAAIFLLLVSPCALSYEIRYPTEEETKLSGVPVVEKYMNLLVLEFKDYPEEVKDTDAERIVFLSKEWFLVTGVDSDLIRLNDNGFTEYRITGVSRNYVSVKGFNRERGWSRDYLVKIIIEDGEYLIQPSHYSAEPMQGGGYAPRWVTINWNAPGCNHVGFKF